jgi:uncharacterized cofD-like protein
VEVATTPGNVLSVALDPGNAAACPQAIEAIGEADWVVLGPGSWYSSVIPHLLVPDLRDALCRTPGKVVVSMNLEPHLDETRGYDLADHLDVLLRHAPDLALHAVLVDPSAVHDGDRLRATVEAAGARLVTADLAAEQPGVHDPQKLGSAYARLFDGN